MLFDPMDCGLPGSSVHGIFQARILEWVAMSFSRRSSCTVGRRFTIWATKSAWSWKEREKVGGQVLVCQVKGTGALSESRKVGWAAGGEAVNPMKFGVRRLGRRGWVGKGLLTRINGLPWTWGSSLCKSSFLFWSVVSPGCAGQQGWRERWSAFWWQKDGVGS